MIENNKNILVIDDEPEMRAALKEVLIRSGYMVSTSQDGADALRELSSRKFDALITDVKMPKMSGLEVLKEVKNLSYSLPVIMITAYGTIDNAVEAMKEGAFDYILKPFSLTSIENSVKRALMQKESLREEYKIFSHPNKESSGKKYNKTKEIITCSDVMKSLLTRAENIARSDAAVFVQGESGTGKELFARHIHNLSDRKNNPFVAINCASLPEGLLESELFGHEKGAFTGAISRKPGKFELANKGTILLDEITEMPFVLQAKLLRVLQEHEVDMVGGKETIPLDIRVIATTNRDLKEVIKKGAFREDLYYRLNVIPIKIPPLRQRPEDIILLANYFFEKYKSKNNKMSIKEISKEAIRYLENSLWCGNVRELENNIERAVLLCDKTAIEVKHFCCDDPDKEFITGEDLPPSVLKTGHVTVRQMEKQLIVNTIKEVDGNRTDAARRLGISIRTLRNKLKEYKEEKLI